MDLESITCDVLIIAHESVLRVLYGYLMACNASDIPSLRFHRSEIIEIIPAAYSNTAKRIKIPDLPEDFTMSPSIEPMHSNHSSAVSVGETSDSDFLPQSR
jgi:6-phosphofructo-2-kinase/fructose-2,6-biphosphatase 4